MRSGELVRELTPVVRWTASEGGGEWSVAGGWGRAIRHATIQERDAAIDEDTAIPRACVGVGCRLGQRRRRMREAPGTE